MIQTWAILKDAYRELNARKMFWIALAISLLVVCAFGGLGINDRGIEVLWFTIDSGPVNTGLISRPLFYKMLFVSVGIKIWLGWGSTILALVSTASIIPDFVSSGAIESMLARPISRARLFLTKYFASLLFVVVKTALFTLVSIVVIGVRGGTWLWSLLWAVPVITLFFSYLYCVSALVGVWTRSTLAALVAALALWGAALTVGVTENWLLIARLSAENPVPLAERNIEALQLQIGQAKAKDNPDPADYARLEKKLAEETDKLAAARARLRRIDPWHRIAYTAKLVLPKTGDTKDLLERVAISDREMQQMANAADDRDSRRDNNPFSATDRRAMQQAEKIVKSRSLWFVLGSSLAFEAVVIGAACWLFSRRDF